MNQLRDVEMDEYGLPDDVVQRIKSMFTTHINVPGATITRIQEITSENSDINRLREIADQLYIAEKELDYAIRSNEFQNRLASVENAKKIQEAQTALELHKRLSEINKDNTLYEDELDSFYMLLSRQKKIREAKSEQELQKALREIAKLDLIDQYDLETLTTDLISKKVDRDAVAEIMAMQSMANIELKRISIDEALAGQRHILSKVNQRNAHELKRDDLINNIELDDISTEHIHKKNKRIIENEGEILDVKLTHRKKIDEYQDNRYQEELKLAKAKADLEFEEEERREKLKAEKLAKHQRMNMDMFKMWADEDEKKEQNAHHRKIEEKTIDYGHVETMADKMAAHQQALKDREIELRKVGSTMSAEQLLAEQASKLDAVAQSKLAESFGDSRASEIERRLNQKALEEANAREKLIREEAERREQALREDQKRFFDQLSSDRDSMMKNVMGMMGMVVNAKSQADQHSQEVEHLRTHINYTDRENAIRREEYERTHQRLLHEEQRNDHTYSKVLSHEEKIQEAAVNMATRTRSYPDKPKIICPDCGKEVPLEKFCKECGHELEIVLNRK